MAVAVVLFLKCTRGLYIPIAASVMTMISERVVSRSIGVLEVFSTRGKWRRYVSQLPT